MSIFTQLGVRDGKDRVKEGVLYNLAACYCLVERKISHLLAPYDLSPVKMNALLMIRHVGKTEGLPQVEIGKRMIVSAGNITRLVDRLEEEKLVERVSKPGDRRVKLIRITKKASDLLEKVWPLYKGEVEKIVSVLPSADIAAAGAVLNGFRERLSESGRQLS